MATNCAAGELQADNVSKSGWYQLDVPNGDVTTFTVRAQAINGRNQWQDTECRTFTVDQAGVRTATNDGSTDNTAECWR